jgi:transcriptional regulator with XRE-family HTH domain
MITVRKLLGEVLKDIRVDQGLTLREVSEKSAISLGYISEIERGKKEVSSEVMFSLCKALDVPLSQVFGEVTTEMKVLETV